MEIRCGHCSQFVGEVHEPVRFVGMFEDPKDRLCLPEPRSTWRCGKCGWATIFRPERGRREQIETKGHPT
jgi:hypothetical protein